MTPPRKITFGVLPARKGRASWQLVNFDSCKRGETAAKTGCTPESGEGEKEEGRQKDGRREEKNEEKESALDTKYRSYLDDFVEKEGDHIKQMLTDGEWSKGECDTVSRDIVSFLKNRGVDAQVIGVTGLKDDLDKGAAIDWVNFVGDDPQQKELLWHAVVFTGDSVIDVTGSQYGEKYAGARIMSPSEFMKVWETARTHPDLSKRMGGVAPEDITERVRKAESDKLRAKPGGWKAVNFDSCKRGETSAKTGCTPESGEGEKKGSAFENLEEGHKYANDIYGGWHKELSEDQKDAIDDYKIMEYLPINKGLREGKVPSDQKERMDLIDKAIESAPPLSSPLTVYRNLGRGKKLEGLKVGDTLHDKAYGSTSLSKDFATGESEVSSIATIEMPQGAKVAYIDANANPAITEGEFLIPKGADFKIKEIEKTPKGLRLVLSLVLP